LVIFLVIFLVVFLVVFFVDFLEVFFDDLPDVLFAGFFVPDDRDRFGSNGAHAASAAFSFGLSASVVVVEVDEPTVPDGRWYEAGRVTPWSFRHEL
jgi:hypothetical protein